MLKNVPYSHRCCSFSAGEIHTTGTTESPNRDRTSLALSRCPHGGREEGCSWQTKMQMVGVIVAIGLLSLLKLSAEKLKKGKPPGLRLKDEPERFPKGFFHRNLTFYKGLSDRTCSLVCELPRRRTKSPGDKTGQKTLNNLTGRKQVSL